METDEHLWIVRRYAERNALRAGLVGCAEEWRWGSLYQWVRGDGAGRPLLADPPGGWPAGWVGWVNQPQTVAEEEAIRQCSRRGRPYGSPGWVRQMVESYAQQRTVRDRGRPRKRSDPAQRLLFE